ncbi:four helix bundle protein [Hydrogenimonas sp.]|uniref:four helix bundle protein n=1 Tax=Hydrogenimonas sp. TaxID=2231112 RepID=UPI00260F923C|nr:four helix bundle protein [Hydrogenimonas sp.]
MMDEKNEIASLSFLFAVRIVKLYKYLNETKKEYTLSRQLLRSGTSIGANVTEAQSAQSKKDFISKMSIAQKEARESAYWIRLLQETDYLPKESSKVKSLENELESIVRLLSAILISSKNTET